MRLKGEDVLFVCGSDEHGAAITIKAKKEGITPQEVVDRYDAIIRKSFADFGIDFDIYHRTSSELHHETASDYFLELLEKDAFTVQESEQYFDAEANQFLADRYITVPQVWKRERLWRSVRKLRQRAEPHRSHRPEINP